MGNGREGRTYITKQNGKLKILIARCRDPLNRYDLARQPRQAWWKRIQVIYSRGDPFREFVVTVPGLAGCGGMLAKGGKDSIGGIAGLKPRNLKERPASRRAIVDLLFVPHASVIVPQN